MLPRAIRAVTRSYPFRDPSNFINIWLGKLIFDRDEPRWIETEAYRGHPAMWLDVSTPFQRKIFLFPRAYARHWYGQPLAAFLRAVLGTGHVFLDVGANVGYYTYLAAGLVGPSGRVVGFEPDPQTYASISRSLAKNGLAQASCVNAALSNRRGELELHCCEATSHSLVEATKGLDRYRRSTKVSVTTLDDWWPQHATGRLDVIKIDIEGEEARAAAGMLATLQATGYPHLWIEVRGPKGSTRAPDTFRQVVEVLAPLGYVACRWTAKRGAVPVSVAEVVGREDILFLHPTRAAALRS